MVALERTYKIYAPNRQAAIADALLHFPRSEVYSARAQRGRFSRFNNKRLYKVIVSEDLD